MHEHKCDLPTSVQWISDLNDRLVGQVLSALKEIPSFGNPVFDQQVSAYVDGLGSWVRGHDSWSFEVNYTLYVFVDETDLIPTPRQGERYFGKTGPEAQKYRVVDILPKTVKE